MRTIKITVPELFYEEIGHEAHLAGVSIAQFIRGATISRIAYQKTKRGEFEMFNDDASG